MKEDDEEEENWGRNASEVGGRPSCHDGCAAGEPQLTALGPGESIQKSIREAPLNQAKDYLVQLLYLTVAHQIREHTSQQES